jgi:hypothetical protein
MPWLALRTRANGHVLAAVAIANQWATFGSVDYGLAWNEGRLPLAELHPDRSVI